MKLTAQFCLCLFLPAAAFAQTVELGNPNGRQIATGAVSNGRAGTWLAVGDVNGDINNKDLFIGAPAAASNRGEVRILFGWLRQTGDFSLDLADVVLSGGTAGDRFGAAVDAGFVTQRETIPATAARDLIVGAPGALGGRGEVYVFAGPLTAGSVLTPANALVRISGAPGDQLGTAVESADLNNDGYRELIAGAPGTGRVYVIDYHNAPTATRDLSSESATLTISGAGIGGVLTVGDITGDAVFDLAMGAPSAAGGNGAVYIVNGRSSGLLPSTLSLPAGANSTFTGLDAGDRAGASVWIKDFDGDGTWDLSITAPDADGPSNSRPGAGDAYVIFGRAGLPATLTPDTTFYGAAAGYQTGTQVRSGDITKDEPDDLVFLASGAYSGFGAVYVYYGRPRSEFPAVVDLSTEANRGFLADASQGPIQTIAVWEVTGEGAEDVAFGVPAADSGTGRIYLSISPRMSVTPDPLYVAAVQGTTQSVPVTVANGSVVTVTWAATPQTGWLLVSPTTGTANITAPGSFTLFAASAGLAPGVYSSGVSVASTSAHLASRLNLPVSFAVLSQPVLTANRTSPASWGTPITWTATASAGGAPLLYEFYRYDSTGGWRKVQPYSASNTYTWTPGLQDAGEHFLQVWVKTAQSPTPLYDAYAGSGSFVITRPIPSITSFVNDGIFPMAPNTPVRFTVNATGGSGPLQYRFVLYKEGTGWSVLQEYSSLNQTTWTPATSGNYVVQTWVRSQGITDQYEAWAGTGTLSVSTTQPVTVLSLTADKAFPAHAGQSITFTAAASGGSAGPLQYQFLRFDQNGGWVNAQPYGPSRTYTWTPDANAAGDHVLQVWVRSAGSSATYEAWRGTGTFSVVVDPLTTPALTSDVVFPVPTNTPVKWTVNVSGGVAPLQYQFWVYRSGTGWTMARDYMPSNTFTWTPAAGTEGTYVVQAYVRNAGSAATYDAWASSGFFTIGSTGAARVVAINVNRSLPAPAGATIIWTAVGSGGTAGPLQYRFVRYSQTTGLWTVLQEYSSSNTFTWVPASSEAGSYVIQAWVRSAGSTAQYEGWASTGFFSIQ